MAKLNGRVPRPRNLPVAKKVTFTENDASKTGSQGVDGVLPSVRLAAEEAKEKKGRVWLTWDEQRIWVVHPHRGSNLLSTLTAPNAVLSREEVKAQLKLQRQMNILPGLHDYPEALWDKVKDHEDVQMALNDGRLHILTAGDLAGKNVSVKDPDALVRELPDSLDEISTGNARLMAEACQDVKTLKRWLQSEEQGKARGVVLTELNTQLAAIADQEELIEDVVGA